MYAQAYLGFASGFCLIMSGTGYVSRTLSFWGRTDLERKLTSLCHLFWVYVLTS